MALTEPYQETLDLKWDHIATELSSYMVTSEKILMSIRKVYPVNIERRLHHREFLYRAI